MVGAEGGTRAKLRRARREDISALIRVVGGPEPARARALRRILKTLVADVYVLERERRIDGVVAVLYRRSVRRGGLVATIDTVESFVEGDLGREDTARLVALALERARRRGCVAIDATVDDEEARRALRESGFASGEARLERTIEPSADARRRPEEKGEDE